MATVGSLAVNVVANNGALIRGLSKSRGAIARFASFAQRSLTTVSIVSGTAAAAVVKSWVDVAPKIDETTKAASRLGVATQRLVGLQHAAGLAGSSADQLTSAMTRLTDRAIEAAVTGGAAANEFARMGINVERLKSLTPDEMFLEVADAISQLPTAAERTNAAINVFGRNIGPKLLPLLMQGRAGILSVADSAEKLGITFTASQGAMVEAANDALTNVGESIEGLKVQLVVGLAPAIAAVADLTTEWITSMHGAAGGTNGVAGEVQGLTAKFATLLDVFHSLKILYKGLEIAVLTANDKIESSMAHLADRLLEILDAIPGINIEASRLETALGHAKLEAGRKTDIAEATRELDRLLIQKTPSERIARQMELIQRNAASAQQTVDEAARKIPQAALDFAIKAQQLVSGGAKGAVESALNKAGQFFAQGPAAIGKKLADLADQAFGSLELAPAAARPHLGVIERGTREGFAFARPRSQLGGGSDPVQKIAEHAKRQTELQTGMLQQLKQPKPTVTVTQASIL